MGCTLGSLGLAITVMRGYQALADQFKELLIEFDALTDDLIVSVPQGGKGLNADMALINRIYTAIATKGRKVGLEPAIGKYQILLPLGYVTKYGIPTAPHPGVGVRYPEHADISLRGMVVSGPPSASPTLPTGSSPTSSIHTPHASSWL